MAKRAPRLQFTQEERAAPELEKVIRKADKRMDKLEKAEAKIPQKKVKTRVVEPESGKVTTRISYAGYKAAGYSKKYLAEHESDIIIHKAAKKAFDELGMKKLPTIKTLQAEYSKLLADKKAAYAEYSAAQK